MNDQLLLHDSETLKHINDVRENLWKLIRELDSRAQKHDASKMENPEREIFAANTPKLAKTEYGSPEYQQLLEEVKPAIDNHYSLNDHHPNFYEVKEVWKDVVDYEGLYKVSNYGRIKNKNNEFLNPPLTPKGYARVSLFKEGSCKNYFVHRLVALAFLSNSDKKPVVNHKNGCKIDNRLANLEWATIGENNIHAYDMGLHKSSVKYVVKCISLDIVTEGCDKMAKELRKHGYDRASPASIWACINEENRKHLDLEFEGYLITTLGDISFVDEMDLVQLCEMICDWLAATKRNKNGNIHKSIEFNTGRFDMTPQLASILKNTVDRYF